MKVNVLITPKKNEVIECQAITTYEGVIILHNKVGRGKNTVQVPVAGFKKWIRFYVLPEEKPSTMKKGGKKNANPS